MRATPATVAAVLLAALVACAPGGPQPGPDRSGWPEPDPDRPVVRLAYEVAEGHATVAGEQQVSFVPDRQVCEIVLRAWPNKPATAQEGNALRVDRVVVDGQEVPHEDVAAGAPDGSPGTLVEVPLADCRPAGTRISVGTDFTVTLGEGTDERLGRDRRHGMAWLGTAYPLLAWQRDEGWVRDDAVDVVGEMTTSETFELAELRVTVPEGEQVAGVGEPVGTSTGDDGRSTHVFRAPAMRDVAVTVGDLQIHEEKVAGTQVRVVAPADAAAWRVEDWTEMVTGTLTDLEELLGPVPYPDLWVSVLPAVSDGVELSGAVQLTTVRQGRDDWLVAHELAHQWFYGLVGSNQARHPWLDETLATYAQEAVRPARWHTSPGGRPDPLGAPMAHWDGEPHGSERYVATVYTAGGALLTRLREQAGAGPFDEAVRAYLRQHAHTVASPEDLRSALADLPGVDEALAEAGAWER